MNLAAPPAPQAAPQATRQAELLDAIVDFLLANGVSDLSLRPLAEGVGTSARLLIYHFGSKENLLAVALGQVRARMVQAIADLGRDTPATSLAMALTRFWDWANRGDNQPYFRLLFELDGLAMYGRITLSGAERQQGTLLWVDMIEALLHRFHAHAAARKAEATLIAAAMAGLLQDRLSTQDQSRVDQAFACLLSRLAPFA
jgi:AcrR family transcriptional regulator